MDKKLTIKNGKNKIRESSVFYTVNTIILVIISLVCFLPFLNVLSVALSTAGFQINFKPEGFTLYNFKYVFQDVAFWRAMGVSFLVVICGTALSVIVMFAAAYALSKKDFPCRNKVIPTIWEEIEV